MPAAFVSALAAEGLTIDGATLASVRGATKREAIAALLPPGSDHAARVARV